MAGWRKWLFALGAMTLSIIPSATLAAPPDASLGGRIKVIIDYGHRPTRADRTFLKDSGGLIRLRYRHVPAIAAEVSPATLQLLRTVRNVAHVEIDHKLTLFEKAHVATVTDPELQQAWGVEHIGAGRAHDAGELGDGVRVAVVDTGIDCSHPDLDANCDGGISYIPSAPFPGGVPFDDYGHGTHVAGIMAAEMSPDHAGVVGVAPHARLFAFKVLDSSGEGDYSGLIAALDQIASWNTDNDPSNDIDVANMSLGGHDASDALHDAANAAHDSGAILVAASGNVNPFDFNELIYGCPVAFPAAYDAVLSTTYTDPNDALTGYSCTGDQVDYTGPGDNVVSTVPHSGPLSSPTGYAAATGTSMASPHLAGTVALVLGHGIDDANDDGLLQDDVKAHLCANTRPGFGVLSTPIPQSDPRYPKYFGCGAIDAGKALVDDPPDVGPPPPPPPNDPPTSDAGGPYTGAEGSAVAVDGTASDPDGDALTRTWSWAPGAGVDAGASCSFSDANATDTSVTCTDDGTYALTLSVEDAGHAPVTDDATLTLTNVAPDVNITAPLDGATFAVGDTVTLTKSVVDPGDNDTRTCQIDWGDGTALTPCASDSHSYAAQGEPVIIVSATDDDGEGSADSIAIEVTPAGPPPPVKLTFTPVADAYVDAGHATTNYGTLKTLRVKAGVYRTYLRFTVTGVTGTVTGAKLRLYVRDASTNGGTARSVASNTWGETTITWNKKPALGTVRSTVGPVALGTWVQFDLGNAVTGNGTFSFAVAAGSANIAGYQSREAANDPQLVVTVTP